MKEVRFVFNIYTPSDVWKWIWDIFAKQEQNTIQIIMKYKNI